MPCDYWHMTLQTHKHICPSAFCTYIPTYLFATDPSKRKSGGPKEKDKEKKEEEDPNKGEDDHPFRIGMFLYVCMYV